MMKLKLWVLALSAVVLTACSQDVRDIKMSQITQEQKEQALKQMKPEDMQYVKLYDTVKSTREFSSRMTEQEKKELDVDRSFNEMISFVKDKIEKEKAGK